MSEVKEFWISPSKKWSEETKSFSTEVISVRRVNPNDDNQKFVIDNTVGIRVIEKSAYDSLQSRLDMAVECLKFYANEDSWRFSSDLNGHEYYEEINLDDVESTSLAMSYGGKKAREVLKKIEGEYVKFDSPNGVDIEGHDRKILIKE